MKRVQHIIDGEMRVHYDGPQHFNGMALCGQDIMGDAMGPNRTEHWDEAVPTNARVNCPHCLAIVAHVRGRSNEQVRRDSAAPERTP